MLKGKTMCEQSINKTLSNIAKRTISDNCYIIWTHVTVSLACYIHYQGIAYKILMS